MHGPMCIKYINILSKSLFLCKRNFRNVCINYTQPLYLSVFEVCVPLCPPEEFLRNLTLESFFLIGAIPLCCSKYMHFTV